MSQTSLSEKSIWSLIRRYKATFISVFGIVFLFLYIILAASGILPEQYGGQPARSDDPVTVEPVEDRPNREYSPVNRIVISDIGVDATIYHPESKEVTVLDSYLKKGAVYYPGSGTPNQGNVFIFGHSTNFSVVQNQAYKTFNDLDKLKRGQQIKLIADDAVYVYSVRSVTLVNADQALVEFNTDTPMLTLSTCNNFGEKQERFVVEADLVETIDK